MTTPHGTASFVLVPVASGFHRGEAVVDPWRQLWTGKSVKRPILLPTHLPGQDPRTYLMIPSGPWLSECPLNWRKGTSGELLNWPTLRTLLLTGVIRLSPLSSRNIPPLVLIRPSPHCPRSHLTPSQCLWKTWLVLFDPSPMALLEGRMVWGPNTSRIWLVPLLMLGVNLSSLPLHPSSSWCLKARLHRLFAPISSVPP